MRQKSSFFKALGIMLLFCPICHAGQCTESHSNRYSDDNLGPVMVLLSRWKEQVTDGSQTLTETTPFPMFRQTQLSYSPISDIRHELP